MAKSKFVTKKEFDNFKFSLIVIIIIIFLSLIIIVTSIKYGLY